MMENSGEGSSDKPSHKTKQFQMDQLSWVIREMTSNLLRVVRGAGKPEDIGSQACAVVLAFEAYREAAGYYPSSNDLKEILGVGVDRDYWERMELGEEASAIKDAKETIISGSLQIAASRLVEQRTQETMGYSEMSRGARELVDLRPHFKKKRQCRPFVSLQPTL